MNPVGQKQAGAFADQSRKFISAAAYAARHSMAEMLEPINWLSRYVNDWHSNADAGLIQVYAYWWECIQNDNVTLTMTIDRDDAVRRRIGLSFYCDSDHASELSRKSTGASAALLQGPNTTALLDYSSKAQPSVSRSSGEAESGGLHELVQSLSSQPLTKIERELIEASADKVKQAGITCQRSAYPLMHLVEFLCKDLSNDERRTRAEIKANGIYVDASVAISAATRGESEVFGLISKTQAVDLLFLHDALQVMRLELIKIDSALNISDLWTKCVSQKVLETLCKLIGRTRNMPPKVE
jgi:hypothetical protein